MDVLKRIDEIMAKQNLSDYQLAKLSGLSASTLSNMRKRNTVPSVPTLEFICESFQITLSQFFIDETTTMYPVTESQREFLDYYILLDPEQQALIMELVKNMKPALNLAKEKEMQEKKK